MSSQIQTTPFIQGPAGKIEFSCLMPVPETNHTNKPKLAIICHPHPLHGGSMHNKVVTTVARTFVALGITSIIFNFRGVGKSEGIYQQGIGETEDALSVIHFAEKQYPQHEIYLAGFSFGAYIALRAASLTPLRHLMMIAPAVNHMNFSAILPQYHCLSSWLIIIAENDTIVPAQAIINYVTHIKQPPSVIRPRILSFSDTSHFFDGKLLTLKQRLTDYLQAYTF